MSEQIFKMPMLLPLDIQYFSDDFDLSKIDQWMQEEQQGQVEDPNNIENPEQDDNLDEQVENPEQVEEVQEQDELDVEDENPEQQQVPDEEQKRNAAFAEMRRQNEQLAAQAAFIQKIASDAGMTVEQLKEQWEQEQLAKQAEASGVPVEFLQRQTKTEQELEHLRQQTQNQRINAEVAVVAQKYNATDEDIKATIDYAFQNGLADAIQNGSMTFEAAHKLAHMDALIENAKKGAVQQTLANKKQRQKEAPVASGGGAPATSEDDLDAEAVAFAKSIIADNHF